MAKPDLLLSFYHNSEEVQSIISSLWRGGYRPAVLLRKDAEGELQVVDPAERARRVRTISAIVLLSALGGLLSLLTGQQLLPYSMSLQHLVFILLGAFLGAGLGFIASRSGYPGIPLEVIHQHGGWLTAEEDLLILQGELGTLHRALPLLREGTVGEPSIFIFHSELDLPERVRPGRSVSLPLSQLRERAERLALEHQLDPEGGSSPIVLEEVGRSRDTIHNICRDLSEASRYGLNLGPIAEWILDNEYIVEGHIRDVQRNLPRRFYRQLPGLSSEPGRNIPRVYDVSSTLTKLTDSHLSRDNIIQFLQAYQEQKNLTIGELWAMPLVLRTSLVETVRNIAISAWWDMHERELANFWAYRLLSVARREPTRLFAMITEMAQTNPSPSDYFAVQLVSHLYDEESVLVLVQNWLSRTLRGPLSDLTMSEQSRQATNQVSIGNAVSSLRRLSLLDWREVFEDLSAVDRKLRQDPSGVYPNMDFETRNSYREAVEILAHGSGREEVAVAEQAVLLAREGSRSSQEESRVTHVGTYLVGERRPILCQQIGCQESRAHRLRQWVYAHHTSIYLGAVALTAGILLLPLAALTGLLSSIWVALLAIGFAAGPASQLAVELVNYLVTRVLPPRRLSKMDFEESGIPDAFKTLVVIPTLFADEGMVREEVEKLEVRYLANPEDNLLFGLFSDYGDSDGPVEPGDETILKAAVEAIQDLNRKYTTDRFVLLHREREWVETEGRFIGWERKRGKLEELNRLISGRETRSEGPLVRVGRAEDLQEVRFVITLDSDTQLPRNTARRMIETLAHPLNEPNLLPDGRIDPRGYTIIQPRVSLALPSATATPFTRLFTNPVGTDPYTKAVSNVYQDLAAESSYLGKGIYDPRIFHEILGDRFPDQWLLSHDLIEGAHVRVGLATDIELFDEFPSTYVAYSLREHRWIRGDWQIADWILPTVPAKDGERVPNPLSPLNRWKIFDNLRRSLVPVLSVGGLLFSWLMANPAVWYMTLLIAGMLLFQPLSQPLTWMTSQLRGRRFSLQQARRDVVRALMEAVLLPHKAGLALDAILRVWYRRLISRKRLLEWTTSQMAQWRTKGRLRRFVVNLSLISLYSLGLGYGLYLFRSQSLLLAVPWLVFWAFTPLIGWDLSREPKPRPRGGRLRDRDVLQLRGVARRTWRYFADFVGPETHWLPPDNYQVSHQNKLAMRTSPTNIGMWMLSALGAKDLGYLSLDELAGQLSETYRTLSKLETVEGHLLNWYNLEDLSPLEPRYISSVDSGNFIASVWVLVEGLREAIHKPVMDQNAVQGLLDLAKILEGELQGEAISGDELTLCRKIINTLNTPEDDLGSLIRTLRQVGIDSEDLADRLREQAGTQAGAAYWARQLARQAGDWEQVINRYLGWAEMLAGSAISEGSPLSEMAAFDRAPSLADLGKGEVPGVEQFLHRVKGEVPFAEELLEAYSKAKWLAGERLAEIEALIDGLTSTVERTNIRFLYDEDRRLFTVGFNVTEGRLDPSFYDLLASEARLGGFVAIADHEVPLEHWLSLGRPYNLHNGHRVLMSWSGTMFEYLMPLIFQKNYPNSLWDQAAHEAVELQILYGRERGVPWGISESAYGDLDINRTYQYKAFGVPWLGLKRGLEEELVIAPYATLLALPVAPRRAMRNLKELDRYNLFDDYGYYEAIDFGRRARKEGELGVVVRAYMAHHQGMSLLSIVNLLMEGVMQERFHRDQRVAAVEPLLYERVPAVPAVHHISVRDQAPTPAEEVGGRPSVSTFDTPHTDNPKVQLLANERYKLMITNSGGGYSRWGDYDLTRWRSDPTEDSWGTFCYLRDIDTGEIWSNTYHPVGGEVEAYEARFPLDRAEFSRTDHGLSTETEMIVSPEDDVEIRRITLINRSLRSRRIELTSYIELAMSPHGADVQHPAFNKLFVETESVPEFGALVAHRRPKEDQGPEIYTAHRLTVEGAIAGQLAFETDRRVFIGRGRTKANPTGLGRDLQNTQGYVLDPIFSLRREVRLSPGQRLEISLVLAAADSRDKVLALMERYDNPSSVQRAFELAWASAQLELRILRIQPDQARRFQHLASYMLYSHGRMRPPEERVRANQKGQAGLWPYGISGDLPIALVTVEDEQDLGVVRQMLQAHTYWRQHGLKADLVILNEEAGGYDQPLKEKLDRLIQAHSTYTGVDQPGGVFLRMAEQMPEEDRTLLHSVASVYLLATRGPLAQQLGTPYEVPEPPPDLRVERLPEEPSLSLPYLELPYFNSLGGFTEDGKEYAIYLGPETNTPAPWVNVMANPQFGAVVSEVGSGFSWYGNSQRNRLTEWSNDPVLDTASEAIYIRDEESGRFWTPTAKPIRERNAYRARHGAGYTVFEHNSHAIQQELTVFVPNDSGGGKPIKLALLRLKNNSSRTRQLSVTYYVEWTLGETREAAMPHIVTRWDEESQSLFAFNGYHPDLGSRTAFSAIHPMPNSHTGDRRVFLGRNRGMAKPAAMERRHLTERVGAEMDPCAALQTTIELKPGETDVIVTMLGQGDSPEDIRALIQGYRDVVAVEGELERTQAWWDQVLGRLVVDVPDLSVNFLINRWLVYQNLSCRIWARSGFYQSGGAYGYRDQLQDVLSLLITRPDIARDHILKAASHQFEQGDVLHWWHPPKGTGVRTRISDDLLWLPYAVAEYVRSTGDREILQESVPFLQARQLEPDEHEVLLTPTRGAEKHTLFEHCQRAVERGLTEGRHGLPLIGTGDWNDGLNRVGVGGEGESVWLAWFLIEVLQGMAELASLMGEEGLVQRYRDHRNRLHRVIEESAWDGSWYIRATFDDGTPLGSSTSEEARIDSLPQSWAWIAGGGDRGRAEQALDSAWQQLVREEEGLALLFTPPFVNMKPSPGYIQGYPPGVRENGGQYTHAALWMAIALARRGDGERAVRLLRILNPVERARDVEEVWRYMVEPYVVTADVYRLSGHLGHGGWSWYTGSAGWMYRAWVEEVLGLKLRGDYLLVQPVIPPRWPGFRFIYRIGEAEYQVIVENPDRVARGVVSVTVDGKPIEDQRIPLDAEPVRHRVKVRMGKGGD